MNRLVSMAQAAKLFGFEGDAHSVARRARRRLRAIAENDPSFVFCKPRGSGDWHTTMADLRRVIPELFRHDPEASPDIVDAIEEVQEKVEKLGARVAKVERVQFVHQMSLPNMAPKTAPKTAEQGTHL